MFRKLKEHLSGSSDVSKSNSPSAQSGPNKDGEAPAITDHEPIKGIVSPRLHSLLTDASTPSVTEAYAQRSAAEQGISVEAVVEEVYGKPHHAHHQYKHNGLASPPPGDQKRLDSALLEQWEAIHPLSSEQIAQVKQYGKWGTNEPSELFLNVSGGGSMVPLGVSQLTAGVRTGPAYARQ